MANPESNQESRTPQQSAEEPASTESNVTNPATLAVLPQNTVGFQRDNRVNEFEKLVGSPSSPPGYEILGKLGQGGMGVVYRARQIKLGRIVALKMMLAGSHADERELARFNAEAEAVARMKHPHVVQIHDIGEHQGLPFLCLEYVEGGSLRDLFVGKPWPPREAVQMIRTVAVALHAAHRQNIVHRDLKPANVLITAEGLPKITDFGLAKRLGESGDQTRTGTILGTPGYMAPEQALGQSKDVQPAADIFALGALLYEAITGRPPFRGSTAFDTLRLTVEKEVDRPSQFNPLVDRDLETICLKCLNKTPERRYASAELLADDLRNWLDGKPIRARRVGFMERSANWLTNHRTVGAAVALLLFGLLLTLGNLVVTNNRLGINLDIPNPAWAARFWLPLVFLLLLGFGILTFWVARFLARHLEKKLKWARVGSPWIWIWASIGSIFLLPAIMLVIFNVFIRRF